MNTKMDLRVIKDLKKKEIVKLLNTDEESITKSKGIFTYRESFYYKHGRTEEDVRYEIEQKLINHGISIEIKEFGEKWRTFKGGASLKNSSHWYVKFRIVEEV